MSFPDESIILSKGRFQLRCPAAPESIKLSDAVKALDELGACPESLDWLSTQTTIEQAWEKAKADDIRWLINELCAYGPEKQTQYWERARLAAIASIFEDATVGDYREEAVTAFITEANKFIRGKALNKSRLINSYQKVIRVLNEYRGYTYRSWYPAFRAMANDEARIKVAIFAVVRCPTVAEIRAAVEFTRALHTQAVVNMGIDFSHCDAHWAYSGFNRFRNRLIDS